MLEVLQQELAELASQQRLRQRRTVVSVDGTCLQLADAHYSSGLLSFCSNDYLGLAQHPDLIKALKQAADQMGVGAGASHLISGHYQNHASLEEALSAFVDLPAALLFSSGYMANMAVLTTLFDRHDALFADKLNHASLNDAALLSRASLNRFPHLDLTALEQALTKSTARRKCVVLDAVFSMDGDIAPLPEILALCEQYDAYLYLDDAHGFGVLGTQGRGSLSHFQMQSPRLIYMATLGKAAGVSGAFVAGASVLIEYLLQKARPYVYTTASPPALAAATLAALHVMQSEQEHLVNLHHRIAALRAQLKLQRWSLLPSNTAIQPLLVGDDATALRLSAYLREKGLWVPAIRPPTVPEGTARLRISLSATHTQTDVGRLVEALHMAEKVLLT